VTTKQLQGLVFPDEPGSFDTVEAWGRFLAEVEAMPDSILKPQTIRYAEYMIALKKEELDVMSSNLPWGGAFIDPPGMFGDTLKYWEQFLAEMQTWSDSVLKRLTILDAMQVIAMKKREKFWA
jgi:hypothetical protein